MILKQRKFRFINKIAYSDSGWFSLYTNKDKDSFYLCHDELMKYVDIPKGVEKILVVLSTNKLSKHSLCITFNCVVYIDGEECTFEVDIRILLEKYLKEYKKIFATIYYWE